MYRYIYVPNDRDHKQINYTLYIRYIKYVYLFMHVPIGNNASYMHMYLYMYILYSEKMIYIIMIVSYRTSTTKNCV